MVEIDELVAANHILSHTKVVDAFGHVSMRHPTIEGQFLLARSMAPSLVREDDIHAFDLTGELVDPSEVRIYVERFIHSEIYRARPDVQSIVHSHSPAVIPFSVTSGAMQPVCHLSGFLRGPVPTFDTQCFGDTDLLIRTREMGQALAETLSDGPAALMRGHGSVVVGSSLREAVFRAVYLEGNAKLQAEASRLGSITFLTPGEAELADISTLPHIDRAWDLWVQQLEDAR